MLEHKGKVKMSTRHLKYSLAFTTPAIALAAMLAGGWWTYGALVYAFGIIPVLELIFGGSEENMSKVEEEVEKKDRLYDFILYAFVPIQYALLALFLYFVSQPGLETYEIVGYIMAFGVACGVFGINVAHELGHRNTWYEQAMSKALLLTSLYMHFFIEHNRGHHKHVATPEDPASARYGEMLYTFYFRSVINGYLSAWRLENGRLRKAGITVWSLKNEMIIFSLLQISLVALIGLLFGAWVMLYFILAATMGFLLLETVNYIEHYGLERTKAGESHYEKCRPVHSWNSNHPVGRIILFELTRHSDHHYMASRKYQVLRHFDESPQMPTGYPGMVLLATVPPLWFFVMHRQLKKYQS